MKQAPSEFFFDESGNTGDLSTVKADSYLSEQRMFALAAFGCIVDNDFKNAFGSIKVEHRIQGSEVKSRQVYQKPRFILELLDLLETRQCPVFIELVDKHYFIVMNVIERMVAPYVGECDHAPDALLLKSALADYMALNAPPSLAHAFAACCQTRSHDGIRNLYHRIIAWAEESKVPPLDLAQGIACLARDSLNDFCELPMAKAVERALPYPDATPAGALVWVLPNLSSFTHIYARVNRFLKGKVSGVTLTHDEQLQFGDILLHNKKVLERLKDVGLEWPSTVADFEFSEAASLRFLQSHESIGLQIADVLAGFIARYVQDAVWGGIDIHRDKKAIFERLVARGDRSLGTGVNFVAPDGLVRFLGITPQPNL